MSIVVTCRDTESGEIGSVTLQPGQFVVCCAEPAHVVSDIAYANGKNNVWVKRNRDEPQPKKHKLPRGICSVCGQEKPLTKAFADIFTHDYLAPGRVRAERCPGSHQPPKQASGGEA